jgi:hypothetical protein
VETGGGVKNEMDSELRSQPSLRAEIEEDYLTSLTPNVPNQVAYYLYIYKDGKNTHDYLQDTVEIAMEQAHEQFGVPLDAWEKVEE